MSLRYARLAPDQRREAVAKLNEKPILALTLRLPWNGFQPSAMYPIEKIGGKGGINTGRVSCSFPKTFEICPNLHTSRNTRKKSAWNQSKKRKRRKSWREGLRKYLREVGRILTPRTHF
jgi:hypothetical protein